MTDNEKFIYLNGKMKGINDAIYTLVDKKRDNFEMAEIYSILDKIREVYYKEMDD